MKNSLGSGHTVRRHLLLLQAQALGQQHLHQPKQEPDAAAGHLQAVSAAGRQQKQALADDDEPDAADNVLRQTAGAAASGGGALARAYYSGGEDVPAGRETAAAASYATVVDWKRFKLV